MNYKILACAVLTAMILSSCAPGKRSFLTVQMCLTDQQGLGAFIGELQQVATERDMKFVDASASTQRDLRAVGNVNIDKMLRNPVINMGLEGPDGVGLIVGNLGLPRDQLVIGFTEGRDAQESQQFARLILSRLSKRWHLAVVPRDEGAKPLSCNDGPSGEK